MDIFRAGSGDIADWIALRRQLWPEAGDHAGDVARILATPERIAGFIARDGAAIGFAEAAIRHDYVNGCETSPVGFLEGIYTATDRRRRGIARALIAAVELWVRAQGCSELGSDALLDNADSHRMHAALGFAETDRVVYFRKVLPG
ncbi:MAG: GNAT family N-acetyltransferase [Proteobacteria bacterium]|nr:GNAT family N-acetyltransferase [Pseudomonadota bacterium]